MNISFRPSLPGTLLAIAGVCSLASMPASVASAETVKTVNGVPIDSSLVDFYLSSRTQQPAEQATPEQREAIVTELTDIYLHLDCDKFHRAIANDEVGNLPLSEIVSVSLDW